MNAVLNEDREIYDLHEFDPIAAIKKTYDKVKGISGTAFEWIKGFPPGVVSIDFVIKFLGIELEKADVTPPNDVAHFFFK